MNHGILPDIIDESFKKYGKNIAIDYENTLITYEELNEKSKNWEMEFKKIGINIKDKVLLSIDNHIEFIAVWIALWRIKCIPIPMESTASFIEINRAAMESKCGFIITSTKIDIPQQEIVGVFSSSIESTWNYIKMQSDNDEGKNEDRALFFYTSGTTGLPKCVVFGHEAMKENVLSLAQRINISSKDIFFTPLSPVLPATIATVVLPTLCAGATLVTVKNPLPGKVLRKIVDKNVTVFFAVPYMYNLLVDAISIRKSDIFKNVRLCLTSSAFMENSTFEKFYELTRMTIRSIYCSSEGGAISYNDAEDLKMVINSVGRAFPGVNITVLNSMGNPAEYGEIGEIYVSGSHLASGYYNRPEIQEKVFSEYGIKTGDIGALDKDGYIMLYGRSSDTINVSGHLVNPREIEEVMSEIAAISEVVVYSKRDENLGECIASKVVLKDCNVNISIDEILEYCSKRINHYKLPRYIEFVDEIPKSRYGKKVRTFKRDGGQ